MIMSKKTVLYVSCWNHFAENNGIAMFDFNTETGELSFVRMVCDIDCNVTKYDCRRNLLFVANETSNLPWTKKGGGGRIMVYSVDKKTGELNLVCEQLAYASNPCQFSQDPTGRYLVVANHGTHDSITKITKDSRGKWGYQQLWDDAPLVLYPLSEDGMLGEPLDIILRDGEGPLKSQQHSMLHSVEFSPDGKFFEVSDKGSDRVYTFAIDSERDVLIQLDMINDLPGSTPRYCLFHPNLPYMYVNYEGGSMDITRFGFDKNGRIEEIDRVSTVDNKEKLTLKEQQQGMVMDSNGRYLYDVLRGHEEIAVFCIDQKTGALKRIQNQKLKGKWARSCTLSPDGRFLITMCLLSGDIEVFKVENDGQLNRTEYSAKLSGCSWGTFVEING